ncbi:hypothetical protein PTSG_00961 [Salpingoeca rosetta]|uniref:15-cis-phytoene synthase n=1 Tax=Salpingoeca rosetta (strain ATCC 50818 / BSB-021) TaxID=946362 RepID=F2TXZ9_SALR5|nr:uncharacterized protein PTSG_00961 [Salpingoeca rosetta]EGD76258.1 hypothetical protein PTSG_00961 [Salpingoeca rosetta]|eukprot:XP_004998433.1 hypothetical protein PTSG_00961 [Salpingoeca rosetta]
MVLRTVNMAGTRAATNVFAHCRNVVRQSSREHYLTTMLLPRTAENAVFAVRAFNAQISRVRDEAREPGAVKMRFLFWNDVVNGLKGQTTNPTSALVAHPVAKALDITATQHNLTVSFLKQLVRAREAHSDDSPFQTMKDAENYAEHTCSSLYYLTLECMGIRDQHADHVASHIGRAEGLVTLLRGLPHMASQGKLRLPLDVCAKHGVVQQDVLRGNITPAVQDAVHAIASEAVLHLNTARSMMDQIPQHARTCFLPSVCLNLYLNQLLAVDFDPMHPTLLKPQGLLPLRLLWARFRNSYP